MIKLRGQVFPIVDLWAKFGMGKIGDSVKILLDIDKVLVGANLAIA